VRSGIADKNNFMEKLYFYLFSFLTLAPALLAALSTSPVYAVLNLAFSFFSLAGLYILLSAEFVAVSQIIVYTGAIVILFLFVVMVINIKHHSEKLEKINTLPKLTSALLALGLLVSLISLILKSQLGLPQNPLPVFKAIDLAKLFLGDYLLPFELISLVLLLAIIGTVVLAKNEEERH
jgi:NADH-quinone oxidoreductase subunit J